jgi:hypothetical protein
MIKKVTILIALHIVAMVGYNNRINYEENPA